MRHHFIIATGAEGYRRFTRSDDGTLSAEVGLEVENATVRAAQRTLDALTDRPSTPFGIAAYASRPSASREVLFAYSVATPATDVRGVQFFHACWLRGADVLPAVMIELAMLAGPASLAQTRNRLRQIAAGSTAHHGLLEKLALRIEEAASATISTPLALPEAAYTRIKHDCLGGQVVAWLTLAMQQAVREGAWAFHDALDGAAPLTVLADTAESEVSASAAAILSGALGSARAKAVDRVDGAPAPAARGEEVSAAPGENEEAAPSNAALKETLPKPAILPNDSSERSTQANLPRQSSFGRRFFGFALRWLFPAQAILVVGILCGLQLAPRRQPQFRLPSLPGGPATRDGNPPALELPRSTVGDASATARDASSTTDLSAAATVGRRSRADRHGRRDRSLPAMPDAGP